MSVKKQYRCDVCNDEIETRTTPIIGIKFVSGGGLTEISPEQAQTHICPKCLSSLQTEIPLYCGAGVRGCNGGRKCGSSHK